MAAGAFLEDDRSHSDDIEIGIGGEGARDLGQYAVGIKIVGIQKADDLAIGKAQALVHRIVTAVVRLADDPKSVRLRERIEAAVTRNGIKNDVLELGIVLPAYAVDGGDDMRPRIEARR